MESCDMFQEAPYVGGFETIENAFCFSVYDEDGAEYWFQLKELQKFINDPNAFENQYFAEIRGV